MCVCMLSWSVTLPPALLVEWPTAVTGGGEGRDRFPNKRQKVNCPEDNFPIVAARNQTHNFPVTVSSLYYGAKSPPLDIFICVVILMAYLLMQSLS